MFDPTKPFNTLPLLPTKFNYDRVDILKAVNKANIALAKLNVKTEKIPNRLLLISPLLIRESVASSGIENINTTVQEVLETEVLPEEKRHGAAKEVLHYRDAMLYGLEGVTKKGRLSVKDFVDIQAMVEPGKKGIRKVQVKIINHSTGEVLYTPPAPARLLRLLKNLEGFIDDTSLDVDPLIKMAMLHYQFESIHPFLDGNGRVGRILMILYLVMMGRLISPTLFLSGYIEQNRKDYYRHLQEARRVEGVADMILFFLRGVEVQSMRTAINIEAIEALMKSFEVVIEKKMKVYASHFVQCLFSRAFLTIDHLQFQLKLSSRQTSSKYLGELVELGLLKKKTVGTQHLFYSPAFCRLLS